MEPASNPSLRPVRVWDLPTRLFHWALALCVLGSVVSAKLGGNAMAWHFRFGYVVFALLAFRLVWGLIGGRWSRFAHFVRGPRAVLRYLGGATEAVHVGHNPLGALSVLALLAVLAAQVGSGLFADDEIANTGPLISLVSGATSSLSTWWHKAVGQWAIYLLVALHIAAILFYRLRKKQDLIGPMWGGDQVLPAGTEASADGWQPRLWAGLVLCGCALLVAWVLQLGAATGG